MKSLVLFAAAAMLPGLVSVLALPQQSGRANPVAGHSPTARSAGPGGTRILHWPKWNVKFRSGSLPHKEGPWLEVEFVAEEAASKAGVPGSLSAGPSREEKTPPLVVVTRNQVLSVYFDPKAEKDSAQIEQRPRSGCSYAKSLIPIDDSFPQPDALVVWARSPSRVWQAAEHLSQHYPVRLVWRNGATEKELVFTVNRCEYAPFLAYVRKFAGERWREIGREFP